MSNCLFGSSFHIPGVLFTDKSHSFGGNGSSSFPHSLSHIPQDSALVLPFLLHTTKNQLMILSIPMFIISICGLMVFNSITGSDFSLRRHVHGDSSEHIPSSQRPLWLPPSQAATLCHSHSWLGQGQPSNPCWINQSHFCYKFGIGRERAKINRLSVFTGLDI